MFAICGIAKSKEAIFIADANGRINQEKGIAKRDTSGQA